MSTLKSFVLRYGLIAAAAIIVIAAIGFNFTRPQLATVVQSANDPVSTQAQYLPVSTSTTDSVQTNAQSTQDTQGEEKQALARTVEGILVEVTSAKIIDSGVEIEVCYATQDNGDWYPIFSHLFFSTYEVYPDEFDFLTEVRADGSKYGKRCVAVRYKIEDLDAITPPIQFGIEELYAVPREGHACERLQERLDTNPKAKAYGLKVKCSEVESNTQWSVELVDHNKTVDEDEAKKVLDEIVQGSLTGPWTFTLNEIQK